MLFQAAATALTAAVPVKDVATSTTLDAFMHQAGIVGATVWVLQVLKRAHWFPALNANTATATRIVSTIAALLGAVAVQISVTGSASVGWHGTFDIPDVHALWDGTIRFIGAKIGQEGLYKLLYKEPVEVTPVPAPPMDAAGKPFAKGGA